MNNFSKFSSANLLLVGKVIKPHGVRGLLRVWSYAGTGESFKHSEMIFFQRDCQEPEEFQILEMKPHKNFFLMKLYGLDSLEKAAKYRGAGILIRKDQLIRNGPDENFWFELIGLKVYLDTGRFLGYLREIMPTGSNDVYVVKSSDSEFLIPAIHEVIKEINLDSGIMIISEMEGLLDLNEV